MKLRVLAVAVCGCVGLIVGQPVSTTVLSAIANGVTPPQVPTLQEAMQEARFRAERLRQLEQLNRQLELQNRQLEMRLEPKAESPVRPLPSETVQRMPIVTHGKMNGKYWTGIPEEARIAYICGLSDVLLTESRDALARLIAPVRYKDIAAAVTQFYQDDRNIPIPIPSALRIVNVKLSGGEKELIDALVVVERSEAREGSK